MSKRDEVEKYFDFVIEEHKKLSPDIKILEKYVSTKNEISQEKENRNYLFHINLSKKYKNVWSVIPGKFTLAFSMAPEFYRIVYKKNPRKSFNTSYTKKDFSHLLIIFFISFTSLRSKGPIYFFKIVRSWLTKIVSGIP